VEGGPDGFLAAAPELPALACELGIGDRLVDQLARGATVWTGSRFEALAEGSAAALLGIEARGEDLGAGFRSFDGGMAVIVEALVARLGRATRTAAGVTGIGPSARGYRLALTGGSAVDADGVILAPADDGPGVLAHAELASLLGIAGAPLWTRAFRWPRGLPRYEAHHAARVARVRERLARLAPIAIAGAGCDGAGVSACVRSGREAAREVVRRLG